MPAELKTEDRTDVSRTVMILLGLLLGGIILLVLCILAVVIGNAAEQLCQFSWCWKGKQTLNFGLCGFLVLTALTTTLGVYWHRVGEATKPRSPESVRLLTAAEGDA